MFKVIAKFIAKYKEERARRNALCKELWKRVDYTLNQEKALFLGGDEVDQDAIAEWRALVAETIAALNEVQFDIFWNIKLYIAVKRRLSYLKDYNRLLDQRVAAHNQRVRDNRTCNQLISLAEEAHTRYSSMFQDVTEFVDPEQGGIWAKDINALLIQRNEIPIKRWQQTSHYDYLDSLLSTLEKWQSSEQLQVRQHNEAVAKNRAEAAYSLIGDVEGRRLDEQQLNCIVKKAHNHLVIAGAGTGKSATRFCVKQTKHRHTGLKDNKYQLVQKRLEPAR